MLKLFSAKDKNDKFPRTLYIILLFIAGAIVAILLIGTIIGLVRPTGSRPLITLGKTTEIETAVTQNDDIRVFSGLGRLRIPLANSSLLILSIAFPYHANDTAFTEELAAKINEFKVIAADYFSSLPQEEIIQIDEETAKTEILKRYNAALRLGRIDALYFSDLMIIDSPL